MNTRAFLILACLAALSATGCYTTGTVNGQQVQRLGVGGNSREILLHNGRITRLRLRPTSWVRFILSDGSFTRWFEAKRLRVAKERLIASGCPAAKGSDCGVVQITYVDIAKIEINDLDMGDTLVGIVAGTTAVVAAATVEACLIATLEAITGGHMDSDLGITRAAFAAAAPSSSKPALTSCGKTETRAMEQMSCPAPSSRHLSGLGGLVTVLLLALWLPALAAPTEGTAGQTVTGRSLNRHDSTARSASSSAAVAAAPIYGKPAWKDLAPAQRQALQPLAQHWDRLTEQHKLKWLALSKNYPSLSPEEQVKLHLHMSKWATLSQQQRTQARQNFQDIKKLTPEQKASQWEAYQALSPEEKRKLANQARTQPAGVTTVTPGTNPKLTQVPRRSVVPRPNLAEATLPVQQHTLLPRPEAARSAAPERSPYEDEPAEAQ